MPIHFDFDPPTHSLCDSCRYAGYLAGGSISIGDRTYRQRYCYASTRVGIRPGISMDGPLECEYHESVEWVRHLKDL